MTDRRVIVLTHEFYPFQGGVATYCAELVRAAGSGVEVWASGFPVETDFPFPVQWLGAGTRLHPVHLSRFALALRYRRRELAGARVVLASVGAQMAWLLAERLGRLETSGLTVLFHGSEILKFERRFWWRSWARDLVGRASRVICVSHAVEKLARRSFLGPLLGDVALAPGAPAEQMRRRALAMRPERDGLRLLTLARIHPRKGQLDTARALARLPVEWKERFEYVLAGAGDEGYLREVETVLREGAVRYRVLGRVSDEVAAELYATSSIYIMSSRNRPDSVEGLGMTYLDAALFGCPSIAYDSGGASEAVLDGETGLVVREGDVGALSGAVLRLLEDASWRERLGEAARARVPRFDWKRNAEILCG